MAKKHYRPGVEPLPLTMRSRPVTSKGWPVPWFVADPPKGEDYDLRIADGRKQAIAIREQRCWVCGEVIKGPYRTFVVGPMCAINRSHGEPPCHADCAHWSARVCPHLNQTAQRRREGNMPPVQPMPGVPNLQQAGVALVWVTRTFTPFRIRGAGRDGVLFELGDPVSVAWYAYGRPATRTEVLAGIENSLPRLMELAEAEGNGAVEELNIKVMVAMQYVPRED